MSPRATGWCVVPVNLSMRKRNHNLPPLLRHPWQQLLRRGPQRGAPKGPQASLLHLPRIW